MTGAGSIPGWNRTGAVLRAYRVCGLATSAGAMADNALAGRYRQTGLFIGLDVDKPGKNSAAQFQELGSNPFAAPSFQGRLTDAPAGGELSLIEVHDFHLGLLPNKLAGVMKALFLPTGKSMLAHRAEKSRSRQD